MNFRLRFYIAFILLSTALGCSQATPEKNSSQSEKVQQNFSIQPRVIYGEDDRLDLFEVEDANYHLLARSTAMMMRESRMDYDQTSDTFTVQTQIIGEKYRLCPEEPFWEQQAAGVCSSFLVAPDILITAGHCIRTQGSCETAKFIFDYALFEEDQTVRTTIPSSDVYSCEKLIHSENRVGQADFAVIQLDRPVQGRMPLAFNRNREIELDTDLFVIGNPLGLPTKVAGGAYVRSIEPDYFVSNLDTYGGNSGSAVFNLETGEIEGILVRGERDFVEKDGCRLSNSCADDQCNGEDVTKISKILPYLNSSK